MAKMYPSEVRDFHGSEGERLVYEALSGLGNDYTVFYSFRWLGNERQRRSEGEADFLVLHPQKGILSIEVKAGGIAYREGQWIQINRNTGGEKVIDPLGQAAESQHRVKNLLWEKFGQRYKNILVGRAAWFTSVSVGEKIPLPVEASPEIILDQDALSAPGEALDRAFLYWQNNIGWKQVLNQAEFKEIIKFLMPSFQIVETIANLAKAEETKYVQLTQMQGAILHFLREQPTAAIHGPAGTGKTMLAVQKANMLAAEGKKVLYLCFNEFLLNYLRASDYDREHITFHNVRTLAEELMQDNSLTLDKVIPAFEKFFADEYDDDTWPYPNLVIDEGQDISDRMLEHLAMLAELSEGSFYVFYDRNQYIMQKEKPQWLDKNAECRLVLYKNCRNTAEIAQLVGDTMGLKTKAYLNEIHGLQPQKVFYQDAKGLEKIANQFVLEMQKQGISPEDFVILTIGSVKGSMLKAEKLGGLPVSEQKEKGRIWFTSVRKFKGLEAKAVLLIDGKAERLKEPLVQRLMYVGCSRAESYLVVAVLEQG